MDSWAETEWLERFRQLAAGRTVVFITHRFTTAMRADTIHVMVEGRVVEGHGGHGFCYEVLHNDGTTSYYEPHELRRLDAPPAPPSIYDRLRNPAL